MARGALYIQLEAFIQTSSVKRENIMIKREMVHVDD